MKIRLLAVAIACAAAGCATPTPPVPDEALRDPVLVQYDSSARAAYADGNFARAERFYDLARARAASMDLGPEVAKAAYNRGACLLVLGRPADARPLLQEAAAEWKRNRVDPAPAYLLDAQAARRAGDTNDAARLVALVVSGNTSRGIQSQGWIVHGQLACDAGDAAEAKKALSRARRLLEDEPALRAGVVSLAGRIALIEGRPDDAALEFDKESALLRLAKRYPDMAEALDRAGGAYATAGKPEDAADRHLRAARSWHGQGRYVEALESVGRAVPQAEQSGNEGLAQESARLFGVIRGDVAMAAGRSVE